MPPRYCRPAGHAAHIFAMAVNHRNRQDCAAVARVMN
jgi:hypothetical protein